MSTEDAAQASEEEPRAGRSEGDEDESDRVRRPGELWRIEGSLYAVRGEVAQLGSLDDAASQARLAALERGWRDELVAILPESVTAELHEYFDWLGEPPTRSSELRIGLAQLAGWLDGVISGLGVSIGEPDSS